MDGLNSILPAGFGSSKRDTNYNYVKTFLNVFIIVYCNVYAFLVSVIEYHLKDNWHVKERPTLVRIRESPIKTRDTHFAAFISG